MTLHVTLGCNGNGVSAAGELVQRPLALSTSTPGTSDARLRELWGWPATRFDLSTGCWQLATSIARKKLAAGLLFSEPELISEFERT